MALGFDFKCSPQAHARALVFMLGILFWKAVRLLEIRAQLAEIG